MILANQYRSSILRCSSKRGFSVIEMIIVLGALVLLAGVVARPFLAFRNEQVITSAAEQVFALINGARADTLAAKDDTTHGVHFESARAVYFGGNIFVEGGAGNEEIVFPARVSASASLNGGGMDVVFARLTGKTTQYGSVVLTLNNNASMTRTITISEAGSVAITQ